MRKSQRGQNWGNVTRGGKFLPPPGVKTIMLIGILSDTHNDIEMTEKALEIFRERDVEMLIHAGDLTSPRMLRLFKDFKCRFVLGNGDLDVEILNEECKKYGFGEIDYYCTFAIEGKEFMVFHGNDVPLYREAVASGKYDYIIKGHTHEFENYMRNRSRIINPGALYGADDEFSVAILDTSTDRVEMIRIERD